MSDEEVKQIVEEFIKRTSGLLPDNFETEDLLEDLKSHIYEGLKHKQQIRPSESPDVLVQEILKELGTPEEIAEEYGQEQVPEVDTEDDDRFQYYIVRFVAALIVAVLAAWIVSIVTEGAVEFYFAVIVLMGFAVIEWFVRANQTGES